jgi:hypothetical protein
MNIGQSINMWMLYRMKGKKLSGHVWEMLTRRKAQYDGKIQMDQIIRKSYLGMLVR